jgi:hypothetical protein
MFLVSFHFFCSSRSSDVALGFAYSAQSRRYCLSDNGSKRIRKQKSSRIVLSVGSWSRKDLPESKRFISCTSDNGRSVGRHGKVEDTVRVSRKCHHLAKTGVAPYHNLIQGVSMSTHNLIAVLRPRKIANLASRVDTVEARSTQSVPEANASISGTTTTRQEPVLMRRPCNGFDGGSVVGKAMNGCAWIPAVHHVQLVIISARSQKGWFVRRPFETANFLFVRSQSIRIRRLNSDITKKD